MGHIKLYNKNGTIQVLGDDALRKDIGDKLVDEAIAKSKVGEMPVVNLTKHPISAVKADKPKVETTAVKPEVKVDKPSKPKPKRKGSRKKK